MHFLTWCLNKGLMKGQLMESIDGYQIYYQILIRWRLLKKLKI